MPNRSTVAREDLMKSQQALIELHQKAQQAKWNQKRFKFSRREIAALLKPFEALSYKNAQAARRMIQGYVIGNPSVFNYLLERPHKDILRTAFPLTHVVGKGSWIELYAMLRLGLGNPNYQEPDLNNTALHVAISINDIESLRVLLRYDAQNIPNKHGITPLDWAKMLGREEAYHILAHHFKTLNEEIKT